MEKAKIISPFISRIDAPKQSDFDKYYYDISVKEVYKKTGLDADGEEIGTIERKLVTKKIDIAELIKSQADQVGVDAYIKALLVQGDNIDNYNTQVGEGVDDYSQLPNTLAEVMTAGDRAKEAFEKLDPKLKGSHTTIEGFLNSLSNESIQNYINGIVEARFPKKEVKEGE